MNVSWMHVFTPVIKLESNWEFLLPYNHFHFLIKFALRYLVQAFALNITVKL